ncbi:pentapeptide repeat-containing protein [Haliscomenobacter hydrossis]|uniref:Pentapeptide repeat protein n=1 Tax=Haliscomenobacter hydrossis (strain ATCC 27775 / DSM 1100 / LMG 10767 / O) TaxID=760192 RepID=F4KT74_HALH1|nr:pentapeptide repeat-containing protein [Haliscomenobacter hydrossis]AEE51131.1 pentapeptide repeat protein [Haliscomenobacter hydrossis DSM 1100]
MIQLIGSFSVIVACILLIGTIYIINLTLPKGKRKEKLARPFSSLLNAIYSDNVKLSIFVTILVSFLLMILWNAFGRTLALKVIGEGVFIEAFGMFFDALILVLLFNFIASKGERNTLIKRYFEEIEDFRYWKASEAKFRIRGNILRLNKLNISKFDLAFLDLSGLELPDVNFNDSTLTDTDFSFTNLSDAQFVGIFCSGSIFNDKRTFLNRANFSEAHIQHSYFIRTYLRAANFSEANLTKVNFEEADLRGAIFKEASIYDSNFDRARVDESFLERLKQSNITGDFVHDMYEIEKVPVRGYPENFDFFLRKKAVI